MEPPRGTVPRSTHVSGSTVEARRLLFVLFLIGTACGSSPTGTASPTPRQFGSADEVLDTLTAAGDQMGGRCLTFPHALTPYDAGSTGELSCSKVVVGTEPCLWQLNVWTFKDDFFAEAGYRKDCAAMRSPGTTGWWILWQPGQNWFGEVSDDDITVRAKKPPAGVARALAAGLGSTAWEDCSAVDGG